MSVWSRICLAAVLLFNFQAKAIEAVTSYTIFYLPAQNGYTPYIELYWQIDPRSVVMGKRADSLWGGTIQTQIILRNDTGIVVNDRFALQTTPQAAKQQAQQQNIIDLQRYSLPAGKMKLELTFRDEQKPQNAYTYNDTFTVTPPPIGPFYSNLQLLDTAYASQAKSLFQKNNQLQIPLSMNFIGDDRQFLHFYSELYHFDKTAKQDGPFIQSSFVSKRPLESAIYNLLATDTIHSSGEVIPFLGTFNISALPSGNYYLNITLQNSKKEKLAASNIFFQRSNTNPVVKALDTSRTDTTAFAPTHKVTIFDLGSSFAGKFTIQQLRAVLRMLMPIASNNEQNSINGFLDKPDETYIRYFIYNFWKERNPTDPEKGWLDYAEKVKDVNKLFSSGSTRGFETERGQIYLKYGKPNERIIALNEPGALPYEVWQYNSPGKQSSQGIFLFYRPPSMINDMVLLHTTVNGELRNMQWRSLLYVNRNADNTNSRVEQYLPASLNR